MERTLTPFKLFLAVFFALVLSSIVVTGIYTAIGIYTANVAAEAIQKELAEAKKKAELKARQAAWLANIQNQQRQQELSKQRAIQQKQAEAARAKQQREQSVRQQIAETCKFWRSTYFEKQSEYNRLMMNQACSR